MRPAPGQNCVTGPGREFPVGVDAGCRNTVYNSAAQSAAEYVGRMRAFGIRHFRVDLLRESAAEVGPLLGQYGGSWPASPTAGRRGGS